MRTSAALLIFSSLLLAANCAPAASAEAADGYVTRVGSVNSFDLGALRVVLTPQTVCKIQPTSRLFVRSTFGEPTDSFIAGGLIHRRDPTAISCGQLSLRPGTPVRLRGATAASGQFVASTLMKFEIAQTRTIKGVALLQDQPDIRQGPDGWSGALQLDGRTIAVTPRTRLLADPAGTVTSFSDGVRGFAFQPVPPPRSAPVAFSANLLRPNTWVSYHAVRAADGALTATQLRFWPAPAETDYLRCFSNSIPTLPDYQRGIPGTLPIGPPAEIVPDEAAQAFMSRLGEQLVPQYQKDLPATDPAKIDFRFYIVKPFMPERGSLVVDTDGLLPKLKFGHHLLGVQVVHGFNTPAQGQPIQDAIALPNGIVLVPDSALAHLRNEAQLAAVLSFAIESIAQEQGWIAWPISRPDMAEAGLKDVEYAFPLYFELAVAQNKQLMRLGMRLMIEAGYDIRQAPFAWSEARGESIDNPVIASAHTRATTPKKTVPWYASYGMSLLSRDYAATDYSKLKTGEAEYANFLAELRKADPTLRQNPTPSE